MPEDEDIRMGVDMVFSLIAANACESTHGGWIWYCDEHDTHGNADSEEEAQFMSDMHVEYHSEGDEDNQICAMYVVKK